MTRFSAHVRDLNFADFKSLLEEIHSTEERALVASESFKPLKEVTKELIRGIFTLEAIHPLRREVVEKKDGMLRLLSFLNIQRHVSALFFSTKTSYDEIVALFDETTKTLNA